MTRNLPNNVLPKGLLLTVAEKEAYTKLVDRLVDRACKEFMVHRDICGRKVDSKEWREIKSVGKLSIRKDRKSKHDRVQTLLGANGQYELVESNIPVPSMLVTGTLPGTIDDFLYGAFIDSSEAHRMRASYLKDQASDFHFLARVSTPTEEDPFRFAGVAWVELAGAKGIPFIWRRDILTLVAMGSKTTVSGERFGYYVIHSIGRSEIPPFPEKKYMRAKCSFCFVFHQRDVDTVEIYQRGFFAPMGDVPERSVLSSVLKNLVVPTRLMESSQGKKLHFMMKRAPQRHPSSLLGNKCAAGCQSRSRTGGTKQGTCVVCRLPVCSACKVPKKIAIDANRHAAIENTFSFCLVCVNKAKATPAAIFAQTEVITKTFNLEARQKALAAAPAGTDVVLYPQDLRKPRPVSCRTRRGEFGMLV
ncbi:hypothetical protein Poli38472_008196 [Pythium oligandrum]|uniref:Uncharacterized protein n=1 Tax=Pythium oligandrum TaxID=41045 RepID=A0A8K1CM22_PYTOL|nr:hypothetical protein Poli38472_008196 [Pythium oligandrum]|eukprot:TMW65554.1 hypothetical protein Poli38472_008196 [Pythium oligandrum]